MSMRRLKKQPPINACTSFFPRSENPVLHKALSPLLDFLHSSPWPEHLTCPACPPEDHIIAPPKSARQRLKHLFGHADSTQGAIETRHNTASSGRPRGTNPLEWVRSGLDHQMARRHGTPPPPRKNRFHARPSKARVFGCVRTNAPDTRKHVQGAAPQQCTESSIAGSPAPAVTTFLPLLLLRYIPIGSKNAAGACSDRTPLQRTPG